MKKFLLGLLIVIVLIVGALYGAVTIGKKVDVKWTEEDYNQVIAKANVKLEAPQAMGIYSIATGKTTYTGSHPVEQNFSSAEVTALAAKANDSSGPIQDVRVNFLGDGRGEVSFDLSSAFSKFLQDKGYVGWNDHSVLAGGISVLHTLSASTSNSLIQYISGLVDGKPVYATGSLERTGDNSIDIQIDSIQVGQVPMSTEVINKVETEVLIIMNALIASDHGFSIQELRVEDGNLYYKGTVPDEIQGIAY